MCVHMREDERLEKEVKGEREPQTVAVTMQIYHPFVLSALWYPWHPPTNPLELCMKHPAPKCWRNKSVLTQTELTLLLLKPSAPTTPNCASCLNCKPRRRCLNVLLVLLLSGIGVLRQRQICVNPLSFFNPLDSLNHFLVCKKTKINFVWVLMFLHKWIWSVYCGLWYCHVIECDDRRGLDW